MAAARFARLVLGSALALMLAACAGETTDGHPPDPFHGPDGRSQEAEPEPPPLTREQLEWYYVAQVDWRNCVKEEGFDLSEPPSLEEFVTGGGAWWAGAELSARHEELQEGGPGPSEPPQGSAWDQLALRCGEAPVASDFRFGREALERLYAWYVKAVACVEAEGFPLDDPVPSLEEFRRTGGTNWAPAREFTGRYGFPKGPVRDRLANRCGNPNGDLWLHATDFEVERAVLEAQYESNLALTACLEDAGFNVPDPPTLQEFVDELGWNWASVDIWRAVYRDNDRDAVLAFVERIDQACPGAS